MKRFDKVSERPPAFIYPAYALFCESLPMEHLAAQFGTPLYLYSATAIRERFQTFDTALP